MTKKVITTVVALAAASAFAADVTPTKAKSGKKPSHVVADKAASEHHHRDHSGLKVTIGGKVNAAYASSTNKAGFKNVNPADTASEPLKPAKAGVVSDATFSVGMHGETSQLKYGAKIVLDADVSDPKKAKETFGYVETMAGRLEIGSTKGVADKYNVAKSSVGTGGAKDGDWIDFINPAWRGTASVATTANEFLLTPGLVSTQKVRSNFDASNNTTSLGNDKANKINYFTPVYYGVQVGLSYVPDTSVSGSSSSLADTTTTSDVDVTDVQTSVALQGFKNVFVGGVKFEHAINGAEIKLGATMESGSAKSYKTDSAAVAKDRYDLKTWEVSGSLGYMGATLNTSYGKFGKSGQYKHEDHKNIGTQYATVGLGYDFGGFSASAQHMKTAQGGEKISSSSKRNIAQATSFGVEYKLAQGLMPYAEFTKFKLVNKRQNAASANGQNVINKGNVVLVGTKLMF